MWVARFKVWHKGSVATDFSKKYDVEIISYNLNLFSKNGASYIMRVSTFRGKDAAIAQHALQKDKRVKIVAIENNQIYYYHKANVSFHSLVLNSNVFFLSPNSVKSGYQYWTCGATKKQHLTSFYGVIGKMKNVSIELLEIKQENANFFLSALLMNLTKKQLNILQFAVDMGYYEYPRKINLEKLASTLKIPRTTLQNHLRKAERSLIPAILNQTTSR